MPGRIRVLSESVINRIAAGEVIERPVSVVKELVENSLDAQASSIRVEIESGGRRLIRVRDDGVGMSHDDAFLALERHATSKLTSEKDLHNIGTLGFRGEALASVASISRLRLLTRDDSDSAGTEIVIEGGVLRKSDRIGMGRGTTIEVANLFYNVPVRRKFLKSANIEAGYIQELLTKLALAFTSVAFTYSEEGRVKLDAPPVRSTFERIHTLYSKDVRDNLVEVDYHIDESSPPGICGKATVRALKLEIRAYFCEWPCRSGQADQRVRHTGVLESCGARSLSACYPFHRSAHRSGGRERSSAKGRGSLPEAQRCLRPYSGWCASGRDGSAVLSAKGRLAHDFPHTASSTAFPPSQRGRANTRRRGWDPEPGYLLRPMQGPFRPRAPK